MRVWRTLRLWVDDEAQSPKFIGVWLTRRAYIKMVRQAFIATQTYCSGMEGAQPNKTWADRYYPGFAEAMVFLEQSQKEEEREARDKEETRKRELAQAQALAAAKARTAKIFKFACIGVSILAIFSVYSTIQATFSKNRANTAIQNLALRSEKASDLVNKKQVNLLYGPQTLWN